MTATRSRRRSIPADHRWVDTDAGARRPRRRAGRRARARPRHRVPPRAHVLARRSSVVQLGWPGGIALVDTLAVDPRPLAAAARPRPRRSPCTPPPRTSRCFGHVCGTVPAVLFDTQVAAGFVGYGTPSLASLVQGELGIALPEGRPAHRLAAPPARRRRPHLRRRRRRPPAAAGRPPPRPRSTERGRLEWAARRVRDAAGRGRSSPASPTRRGGGSRRPGRCGARPSASPRRSAAWRERRAGEIDQPDPLRAARPRPRRHRPEAAGRRRRRSGGCGASTTATCATAPPTELLAAVRAGAGPAEGRLPAAARRRGRPRAAPGGHPGVGLGQPAGPRPRHRHRRSSPPGATSRRSCATTPAPGWPTGWRAEAARRRRRAPWSDGGAALAFDGKGGLVLEERSRRAVRPSPGRSHSRPDRRRRAAGGADGCALAVGRRRWRPRPPSPVSRARRRRRRRPSTPARPAGRRRRVAPLPGHARRRRRRAGAGRRVRRAGEALRAASSRW